jgi:predicted NBD/HSP70 family sugar kinase
MTDSRDLLRLIREGRARTRGQLAALTGLGRSTVSQRVDRLIRRGLVLEVGSLPSTGGRRAATLQFNRAAGVVLAADLGITHSRIAVTDLGATPLAEIAVDKDVTTGPDDVVPWLEERFEEVLSAGGVDRSAVRGVGIGIPAPVEHATGRVVRPPILARWDGHVVPPRFEARYRAPVLVDNDANLMGLGEHWTHWRDHASFLFVKVGTGIGCGLILDGKVHRGADGAAGDLGHIAVAGSDVLCRCGQIGCVEAIAGGGALARQLAALGRSAGNSRDVVRLVREGDPEAIRLVREAGRELGEVLAGAVSLVNPSVIVLGGDIARAGDLLIAGVREVIYRRSLPLATRRLQVVQSLLDERAGIVGAAVMVIEHLFASGLVEGHPVAV